MRNRQNRQKPACRFISQCFLSTYQKPAKPACRFFGKWQKVVCFQWSENRQNLHPPTGGEVAPFRRAPSTLGGGR